MATSTLQVELKCDTSEWERAMKRVRKATNGEGWFLRFACWLGLVRRMPGGRYR